MAEDIIKSNSLGAIILFEALKVKIEAALRHKIPLLHLESGGHKKSNTMPLVKVT